jgi:hypothetical protein
MGATIKPMRHTSRLAPASPCQAARAPQSGVAGGRPQKTERPQPRHAGHPIHHHVTGLDKARVRAPR